MPLYTSIEPVLPEDRDHELEDLAFDLVASAGSLAGQLHTAIRAAVGDLVRSMNCYYSNLIEGHNTLPHLSERALREFCKFFLRVSIDQVRFMQQLLDPGNLLRRIELYCRDESDAGRLSKAAYSVLREVVLEGELPRSRVPAIVNLQERAARNITSTLVEKGLLTSESSRAPLRVGFPTEVVERWFPSLYPVAR